VISSHYLQYCTIKYNDVTEVAAGEDKIDDDALRQQFVLQQPANSNFIIPSLSACLEWCIDKMAEHANVHDAPPNEGSDTDQVFCNLWSRLQPHSQPPWTNSAEIELGIPAAELLSIVVHIMMAATPAPTERSNPPILRAQAGAAALCDLGSDEQLYRLFLEHTFRLGRQRMGESVVNADSHQQQRGRQLPHTLEALRQFAAEHLGLSLSALPPLPGQPASHLSSYLRQPVEYCMPSLGPGSSASSGVLSLPQQYQPYNDHHHTN
jgi:hypothetical protein